MTRREPADRPPPNPLRVAVERRSTVLLVVLSHQPRALLPLASAVLLAGMVFLPAVPALVCLLALFALVGWLSYLSWPAVPGGARVVRVVVVAALLVLGLRAVLS